jgi:hypothetical protein
MAAKNAQAAKKPSPATPPPQTGGARLRRALTFRYEIIRGLDGVSLHRQGTVGTAKYADHAKPEQIVAEGEFAVRMNGVVRSSLPFLSAYFAYFAV